MTQTITCRPLLRHFLLGVSPAVLGCLTALPVSAQSASRADAGGPGRYVLGGGVQYGPEYEGSADMTARVRPYLSLEYGMISLGPDRIALNWRPAGQGSGRQGLTLSPFISYGGSRDAADLGVSGFDDIDASVKLGLRATYVVSILVTYASLERYMGGSEGMSLTLGAGTRLPVGDRLALRFGVEGTFSDDAYMDAYFGVSPDEATSSGWAGYDASAGMRSYAVSLGASYRLSESWSILGDLRYNVLADGIRDSPVVEQEATLSSTFAVLYRF